MFRYIFEEPLPDTFIELGEISKTGFIDSSTYLDLDDGMADLVKEQGWKDTYFGVALRNSKGSEKDNIAATKVLWADIDVATPLRATLPPSIVVFSGRYWHYYWLLSEGWLDNLDDIEKANKILGDDVKADKCWNCNRILRVPNTVNTRTGNLCEIRALRPQIKYTLEEVFRLQKLSTKTRHKIRTGDRRGYKSRSERDWAIIKDLYKAGYSTDKIKEIFTYQPCGDKYTEVGDAYFEYTLGKAIENTLSPKDTGEVDKGVGIFEYNNEYWMHAKNDRKLSTFTIQPTLLLENSEGDAILGNVVTKDATWKDVLFSRRAFNDRRALDKVLGMAAWVWLGRDDDVRQLLPYLLEKLKAIGLPKAKATKVLGRYGKKWVANKQTIEVDTLVSQEKADVLYVGRGSEVPKLAYIEKDFDAFTLYDLITKINTFEVVYPVLGWYMATPYKTLLEAKGVRFPILNIFGTRGSGKTSMIRVFQKLIGYSYYMAWDCTTTRFVMLTLLSSTNTVPISFSEYRHNVGDRFVRYILLSYDVGRDARGRADQTTQEYKLTAPFTIDGEDLINDAAAKERSISVVLHPESIAEDSAAFKAFRSLLELDYDGFALKYIQHTLQANIGDYLEKAKLLVQDAFSDVLPDRVRSNLVVTTVGLCSLMDFLNKPYPTTNQIEISLSGALANVWSKGLGRSFALVDEFVESVVNHAAQNKQGFVWSLPDINTLWFQFSTALDWWLRMRRASGLPTLDREAMRNQLLERCVVENNKRKGQYIISPKLVDSTICYGVVLEVAHTSGLGIPKKIERTTLEITL